MDIIHQESAFRSTETSTKSSEAVFTGMGKSTSMFAGAKYMWRDMMQMIIPKKSCISNKSNRQADYQELVITETQRPTCILIAGSS